MPRRSTHSSVAAVYGALLVACAVVGAWSPARAGAVGEPGASAPRDGATSSPVVPGAYTPPVAAPVVDGFRIEAGPYGPGNRGLEYDTTPGTPVRALGSGRVVFVGPVAGRWALTVLHPDGRRSSLTGIVSPTVAAGELVVRGQVLAFAGERLHLGVREGERYVDPALLFAAERRRAVLVPLGGGPPG